MTGLLDGTHEELQALEPYDIGLVTIPIGIVIPADGSRRALPRVRRLATKQIP